MTSETPLALLARKTLLNAVSAAQTTAGSGPVTSAQALAHAPHLARSPRAFCSLARQVAALGADELGWRLASAGETHGGQALWTVLQDAPATASEIARRAAQQARPGEALESVLLRALAALEREQAQQPALSATAHPAQARESVAAAAPAGHQPEPEPLPAPPLPPPPQLAPELEPKPLSASDWLERLAPKPPPPPSADPYEQLAAEALASLKGSE
jgi:hypothetical protein